MRIRICFSRNYLFFLVVGLMTMCFSANLLGQNLSAIQQQLKLVNSSKQHLTQSEKKINTMLRDLVVKMKTMNITQVNAHLHNAASLSNPMVKVNDVGAIQCYIYLTDTKNQLIQQLRNLSVEIELINEDWNIIQAWIPFNKIDDIANLDFVKHIRPPGYAIKMTGSVNSEGDAILRADDVRNNLGFNGSGVKVGIISDGVNNRSAAQATGDLPSTIDINPNLPGNGDEGTAMLEIVHDLAPGANLAFSGPNTSLTMVDAINYLANSAFGGSGSDIIVDDLGFLDQPFFEDGPIAQAVENVVASGITYFTSAGNQAEKHYEKNYVDQVQGDDPNNFNFHDFGVAAGGTSDNAMDVLIAPNSFLAVFLQWDDPFGGSANDYDLYIYDETGNTELANSEHGQDGDDDPCEIVSYQNTTASVVKVLVLINRYDGSTNKLLELHFNGIIRLEQYNVPEGSICPGHQAAKSAITVGAIDVSDPGNDDAEDFSSHGPVRIFFPAAETRLKPDIAATDGNLITGAGGFGAENPPGTFRFFGTSAASPHAAAVAALILSANANLSPSEVKNALKSTAVDLGVSGMDNTFGSGRIDAFAAVQSVLGGSDLKPPKNLTATVAGNNVTLNWEPPDIGGETQEVELKFDDNSFENAMGFSNGTGTLANGPFVPSAYPATLKSAKFVTNGYRTGDNVKIRIYVDASGAASMPSGNLLAATVGPVAIGPGKTFQEVDLAAAGITLSTGARFFIGVEQLNTENFGISLDENAPDGHAFYGNAEGDFHQLTNANFHGVFGIRAVVEIPVASLASGANCLEEMSPINYANANNHFANNSNVHMPVKLKNVNPFIAEKVQKELRAKTCLFNLASLQSYNIYRSTTAPVQVVSQNKIGNVSMNSTDFNDVNLPGGLTYYYVVTAVYDEGESDPSNQVSAQISGGGAITWQTNLSVKDAANESSALTFGQGPDATDDLDSGYGEAELPPFPPTGVFEARFELPVSPPIGSLKDYRNDAQESINWRIKFQPGAAGYPLTFTWNSTDLPEGSFYLKDEIVGTLVNVNLKSQNSYSLSNPGITSLKIEYTRQISRDVNVLSGWNIVSVPLEAADMSVSSLFPDATSSAFGYNNGYVTATTLSNGAGYWLKFSGAHTYTICGSMAASKEIAVKAGWNIIGPFETDVQVTAITSNPAGIIASNFFGYNNSYTTVSTLRVSKGYWVKTRQAGTLIISSAQMVGKIADRVISSAKQGPDQSLPKLLFTDADGSHITLFLAKESGGEQFELPPVPPAGVFDVRFSGNRYSEKIDETGQQILINSAKYPMRIKIENIDDNQVLKISDLLDGKILNETMTAGKEIVITSGLDKLSLEYSNLPARFALFQNYPNPSNPMTEISYSLPEDSQVKIAVYNSLGQKMIELVNQKMSAGHHKVQLNAQNFASGIYYYRMESKHFVAVKKMIILK